MTRAGCALLAVAAAVAAPGQVSGPRGEGSASSRPAAPADSQPVGTALENELYRRGCALLEAGDAAGAVGLLSRASASHPEDFEAALKLAEALAQTGDRGGARRLLEDLSAQRPGSTRPRVLLGGVHALDADWAAVVETLAPIEAELDVEPLALLARAHLETKRATRALNVLQRGIERRPDARLLWLTLIDQTLELKQFGLALRRTTQAQRHLGPLPQLHYRAAQAHYRLGQVLGRTRVMRVPGGRTGQFARGWLLVEEREDPDLFLCCPRDSALYEVRRALDGGLDEPEVHLLHARIWQGAGRPQVGLAILQSREALWLEDASMEMMAAYADLALECGVLEDFLRYSRLRAAREPRRREEILHAAFLSAAQRYNQRGDDLMYRELLRRALTLRPENLEVMLALADAIWEGGDREEAEQQYRRVLEREPDHRERGRILERLAR